MSSIFSGPLLELPSNGRDYFRNMPLGNDPDYVYQMLDFLTIADMDITNNWTSTETEAGAGDAAITVQAGVKHGTLKILNDAADNDAVSLQQKTENYKLESGKKLWLETKCQVSDADQVDFFIGLAITDTSPLDASDRVGFRIEDESASILCETTKDSATTQVDSQVDASDSVDVKLGFYYDGASSVYFYVNRALVSTHTTNIPDDEELALTIHIQNGAAAAKHAIIDYILAVKER
jgi:hypothetical protein